MVCWDETMDGVNVAVATSDRCPFREDPPPPPSSADTGPPLSRESWEQSAATELLEEVEQDADPNTKKYAIFRV